MATTTMTGETSVQYVEEPSRMSEKRATSSGRRLSETGNKIAIELRYVRWARKYRKEGAKAEASRDILRYLTSSKSPSTEVEHEMIVAMFWVRAQAEGKKLGSSDGLPLFKEWERAEQLERRHTTDAVIETESAKTACSESFNLREAKSFPVDSASPDKIRASVSFTSDPASFAGLPGPAGREKIADEMFGAVVGTAQIKRLYDPTASDHDSFKLGGLYSGGTDPTVGEHYGTFANSSKSTDGEYLERLPRYFVPKSAHDGRNRQNEICADNSLVAGGGGGKDKRKPEVEVGMKTSNEDIGVTQSTGRMPKHSTASGHTILSSSGSGTGLRQADGAPPPTSTKNAPDDNHVASPRPGESVSSIAVFEADSKLIKKGTDLDVGTRYHKLMSIRDLGEAEKGNLPIHEVEFNPMGEFEIPQVPTPVLVAVGIAFIIGWLVIPRVLKVRR